LRNKRKNIAYFISTKLRQFYADDKTFQVTERKQNGVIPPRNGTQWSIMQNTTYRLRLSTPAVLRILEFLLADHIVRSMMGYWHDNVVCLSVCPSACDAVHCG